MKDNDNIIPFARLKHHIDVPNLEEVWLDGFESAQAELEEERNPYRQGSTEYFHWNEGWWAGFYEEEPLFDLAGNLREDILLLDSEQKCANDEQVVLEDQQKQHTKQVIKRVIQVAGVIFVALAAYELAELAA
ncbi:MAG: transmission trait enhancer LetE [Legionellales bacterium]|nr:transmission trait enhancer LetE [Legionellales bacterium]|tara:strand:+ start:62351 stop:62749 length:399 start_codon:yes stop_codon:yes gene_type:complete